MMKTTTLEKGEMEITPARDLTNTQAELFLETVSSLYNEGKTKFSFNFHNVKEMCPLVLSTMLVLGKKLHGKKDASIKVRKADRETVRALKALGMEAACKIEEEKEDSELTECGHEAV